MTDKLDILARLDAMSDVELFERLAGARDYGLTEVLGSSEEFLGRHRIKHTYCPDEQRLLSFSVAKKQKGSSRMYLHMSRIKEAGMSRLNFFNDQLPSCA
ncbi:hypothetical protein Q8W40_13835 [Vibrio penaeicida]|uniref:hypothetical protein n=1 Tax=Vibrio penaeicida TaxID=104609 RepID=UPI002736B20F|nr:hypothetical protein [Vibrio penaeicida]MDP2573267.1 hypothetical protein [Vibrio penaeicida]